MRRKWESATSAVAPPRPINRSITRSAAEHPRPPPIHRRPSDGSTPTIPARSAGCRRWSAPRRRRSPTRPGRHHGSDRGRRAAPSPMPGSAGWRSNGGWGTSATAPAIARASSRPSAVRGTSVRPVCRRSTLLTPSHRGERGSVAVVPASIQSVHRSDKTFRDRTRVRSALWSLWSERWRSRVRTAGVYTTRPRRSGSVGTTAGARTSTPNGPMWRPTSRRTRQMISGRPKPGVRRAVPAAGRAGEVIVPGGVPAWRGRGASWARRPRTPRTGTARRIGSGPVAHGRAHSHHRGDTRRGRRGVHPTPARLGDRKRAAGHRTRD